MPPKGSTPKKEIPKYIHAIDETPEYLEFIDKLRKFHEARGTNFDAKPRLATQFGHVNLDLYVLYKAVVKRGGYDELCKIQKAWGALANDLGMYFEDSKGMGQLSFQLKQDFYKNLGAYWIKDQYGREPPPKEILEAKSCASKFGPLLTRTVESFKAASKQAGEDVGDKEDRPSEASTPVSGNRASGRLREAPPQRVPFQPETGPSRQVRHASSQHSTPVSNSAHHNAHANHTPQQHQHHQHPHPHQQQHVPQHHNPNNPLHLIQAHQASLQRGASSHFTPPNSENASRLTEAFEPRPPVVMPLRPINTPGNNPIEFARRQRQLRMQAAGIPEPQALGRPQIPGVGNDGPNIYTRCLQSLRSGIPAEQAFALNHLVKISYERGDKYKFEAFLGLAEGLIEKAIEIGSLFYHVDWQISYSEDQNNTDISVLDGVNGTDDILDRIAKLSPKTVLDYMQPAESADQLTRIIEAVLTIRNMVILPDNALFMAEVPSLRDLLCIILHLPRLEMLVEIKHFALDIAEQITPNLSLDSGDALYKTLLAQLDSADRGTILTVLRAISRISMNLDATNTLQNVPVLALQNMMNWLLLNDEELVDACLDFLYQYTAVVANVESLVKAVDMEHVVPQLVRLLAHGARKVKEEVILEPERKQPASDEVAPLPPDLHEKLMNLLEPQRCYQWLQSLFEEDAESHITQIAIWQAYQKSFGAQTGPGRSTLNAAEFIRNVSHVYVNARAQIIRGPGEGQRFIIEGIRPRTVPFDYETKEEYSPCQWVVNSGGAFPKRCNCLFAGGEKMWRHILTVHLGATLGEDGKIEDKEIEALCNWEGCSKTPTPTKLKLSELSGHIKGHVLQSQKKRLASDPLDPAGKRQKKSYIVPAKTMSLTWELTHVTKDDQNPTIEHAAGIPLSAVLVLRNIARNVVKTESQERLLKQHEMGGEGGGWNEKLFRPVTARLFEVMTENKHLASYIASLLQLVQDDRA